MILHRLTPGGPANFTQEDVDYCCHPLVKLQDLAQEAVSLNPSLIFRTASDPEWTEIGVQLTLQALYKHQVYLVNHIISLHDQLARDNAELADLKAKIRNIKKETPNNATS